MLFIIYEDFMRCTIQGLSENWKYSILDFSSINLYILFSEENIFTNVFLKIIKNVV